MTYALLGLVALLAGTNVAVIWWYRTASNDARAAEKSAHSEQQQRAAAQEELRLANLTIQAREAELAIVKERLVTAEEQRNEAYASARDHFVEQLRASKIADTSRLIAQLLATDLRTGVLSQGKRSDDPKDGLLNPFDPNS